MAAKIEYVADIKYCLPNNVVRFENKGDDLEEKQGPSKLARHAGIEYDDDDAHYDNDNDNNGDDP